MDPFQEPAEPRLPRGLPEEKLEYFRNVLKQKQETLARARAVYEERDAEAEKLREVAQALRAQLEAALADLANLRDFPARLQELTEAYERERARSAEAEAKAAEMEIKWAQLQTEFDSSAEERKQLSKALAEVEMRIPALTEQVESERASKAVMAGELMEAKESLNAAQSEVAESEAKRSEAEGNLEAVNELYQRVNSESEQLTEQLDRTTEEVKTLAAERDAAIAERDATRGDMDALNAQMRELERQGAHTAHQAQEQARHLVHDAQAKSAALGTEMEQLRNQIHRLQSENAQVKTQAEHYVKKLKEEITASSQKKIGELQAALSSEEDRRNELKHKVTEGERKSEALARQVAAMEKQLATHRGDGESTLRKAREEVAAAQRKATDLQSALLKERREHEALARQAAEAEAGRKELGHKVASLEQAMARLRSEAHAAAPGASGPPAELVAERDRLKADLASMKKKLVAAESAMEVAASLKAKVARLEAALKGKK